MLHWTHDAFDLERAYIFPQIKHSTNPSAIGIDSGDLGRLFFIISKTLSSSAIFCLGSDRFLFGVLPDTAVIPSVTLRLTFFTFASASSLVAL